MTGGISGFRFSYVHGSDDPTFLLFLCGFAFFDFVVLMAVIISRICETHYREKYDACRKTQRVRKLDRVDLEKKFPSEAARFKGLAPILHVDGCTEHQGAHITYITEVEREKLLNGDNDDEPTPHNRSKTSQGNSFEQQGNKKLSAADNVEQGDADDAEQNMAEAMARLAYMQEHQKKQAEGKSKK